MIGRGRSLIAVDGLIQTPPDRACCPPVDGCRFGCSAALPCETSTCGRTRVIPSRRLPDSAEVAAYYIVAEALTNAAKHAQASQVNVRAEIRSEDLHLAIRDDGIGGADTAKGSGLIARSTASRHAVAR